MYVFQSTRRWARAVFSLSQDRGGRPSRCSPLHPLMRIIRASERGFALEGEDRSTGQNPQARVSFPLSPLGQSSLRVLVHTYSVYSGRSTHGNAPRQNARWVGSEFRICESRRTIRTKQDTGLTRKPPIYPNMTCHDEDGRYLDQVRCHGGLSLLAPAPRCLCVRPPHSRSQIGRASCRERVL